MHKKTVLLSVIAALLLCGCLSFPKTESEFRTNAHIKNRFVVDRSLSDSYKVILDNANRCYDIDLLPWGRNTVHTKQIDANSAVITVESNTTAGSGIAQMFDLTSITQTSTEIIAYHTKLSSRTAQQAAEGWFKGNRKCS